MEINAKHYKDLPLTPKVCLGPNSKCSPLGNPEIVTKALQLLIWKIRDSPIMLKMK
jgi:hypothetical protein